MKSKLKKLIKEITIFIVVLIISTNLVSLYRSSNIKIDDGICKDGSEVVYFFASWCPVCKVESPNIDFISKYYKTKAIAVKSPDIKTYMYKNGFSFRYIDDKEATFAHRYNIMIFPTIITCKDKKVRYVDVGYTSIAGLLVRLF